MPPKKRKQALYHNSVATGRAKIRRKHRLATVDTWPHQNVLLFLNNFPPDVSKYYERGVFQNVVDAAVAEAVDKEIGPRAVRDLKSYTQDHGMAFGKQAAGG